MKRVLVEDVKLPVTIKDAIERKLKQEQESLEYEFRLVTANKEAEKQRIEAQGKADANRILSASMIKLKIKALKLQLNYLNQQIQGYCCWSGKNGLPIILGKQ